MKNYQPKPGVGLPDVAYAHRQRGYEPNRVLMVIPSAERLRAEEPSVKETLEAIAAGALNE